MKTVRASLVSLVLIALLVAASAHAQTTTPGGPQPTYDGHCSAWWVGPDWADHGDQSQGVYAEYLCSGNFIGAMQVELQVEYSPKSFSKVTLAPQGYISRSYYGPNVPTWDGLVTTAYRSPDYYSRTVLKVSWETDRFACNWYGCYRVWDSDTLMTPWQ
jgi:hypothetical protein